MRHLDDDAAVLTALGEPLADRERVHLADCADCRSHVAAFENVVELARGELIVPARLEPPARVWQVIATATGVSDATTRTATDGVTRRTGRSSSPWLIGGRSKWLSWAAVAAAGAAIGIAATLGWQQLDASEAALASVDLEPLPGMVGEGHADLVSTPYGDELFMSLDRTVPGGVFLQVWLMSPDATRVVPIGVITTGVGRWAIPATIDLSEYPLVDVSIESYDGDPAHSGDSLVRGALDVAGQASAAAGITAVHDPVSH